MRKKVIPKALLDKAVDLTRDYWRGISHPRSLDDIASVTEEMDSITGINWYSLQNFLSSVFPDRGLKNDATNEDIYAILRLLGWEVSD